MDDAIASDETAPTALATITTLTLDNGYVPPGALARIHNEALARWRPAIETSIEPEVAEAMQPQVDAALVKLAEHEVEIAKSVAIGNFRIEEATRRVNGDALMAQEFAAEEGRCAICRRRLASGSTAATCSDHCARNAEARRQMTVGQAQDKYEGRIALRRDSQRRIEQEVEAKQIELLSQRDHAWLRQRQAEIAEARADANRVVADLEPRRAKLAERWKHEREHQVETDEAAVTDLLLAGFTAKLSEAQAQIAQAERRSRFYSKVWMQRRVRDCNVRAFISTTRRRTVDKFCATCAQPSPYDEKFCSDGCEQAFTAAGLGEETAHGRLCFTCRRWFASDAERIVVYFRNDETEITDPPRRIFVPICSRPCWRAALVDADEAPEFPAARYLGAPPLTTAQRVRQGAALSEAKTPPTPAPVAKPREVSVWEQIQRVVRAARVPPTGNEIALAVRANRNAVLAEIATRAKGGDLVRVAVPGRARPGYRLA